MKEARFIPAEFLTALEESLPSISEAVLYGDERGFQGALIHELNARLGHGVLPDDPIIQQEYQKCMRHHGIKIRPDIIVHIPFERGLAGGRDEGNFVAIELKRKATRKRADEEGSEISVDRLHQCRFGGNASDSMPQEHCGPDHLFRR